MRLGQDRHGDWDDKRIAGWVMLAMSIVLSFTSAGLGLVGMFLGGSAACMGFTIADKE